MFIFPLEGWVRNYCVCSCCLPCPEENERVEMRNCVYWETICVLLFAHAWKVIHLSIKMLGKLKMRNTDVFHLLGDY